MKKSSSLLIIIVLVVLQSTSVFGWGSATHIYLVREIGNQYGIYELSKMYGSVVPDMFNLMFGHPYQDYLWNETHYEFMKVVDKAQLNIMKAFAYGFESHNESYGADYTAHIRAATRKIKDGYVIYKAEMLVPIIQPIIYDYLDDVYLANYLANSFADTAIESAVDYLVSQNEDPSVGIQMSSSAGVRSPLVPLLLSRAYVLDYMNFSGLSLEEAVFEIYFAESQFREYMILYGGILSQAYSLDSMAELGAQLAENILGQNGYYIPVPPGLIKQCLLAAIDIVQDDYSKELDKTIKFLKANM